ncbi:MAG TPA: hypothetical protein VES42_16285 [Pilimelia sp.]|nr:hypothetical protein [Pilimelia sp.]
MPDCRPGEGTPIDAEKLRSLSVLGRRTRPRINEGRVHPETGRPFKTTVTEAGSVTEHATKDDRVDAVARVASIRAVRDPATGRVSNE